MFRFECLKVANYGLPFFYGYDLQMSQPMQTQQLYSQDTQSQATTQNQATPQTPTTPGGTAYTIPVHCGLMTPKSDLNKIHIDIKAAAKDVKTIAGGVLFKDTKKETTDQLEELRDKLTNIPILKAMADTELHRSNASQMNNEIKSLKAKVNELKRELQEANATVAALTEEEEQKDMNVEESNA